ncbi:O-antigen ligase family protein [Vibrio artabrorum]|uniref:O-antigen ligase family protein n=1 Tax=Vibrio artabrorum TaxID=446374 RepID=UPI00354AF9BD
MIFPNGSKIIVPIIILSIITNLIYYKNYKLKGNLKNPYLFVIIINILIGSIMYYTIGFGSGEIRSYIAISLYLLLTNKTIIDKKNLTYLTLLAACISFFLLIYNVFTLEIPRGVQVFNPIPYANVLTIYAVVSLYLLLCRRSYLLFISYFLLLAGIFLTETRGAIIPVIIVSFLMIATHLYKTNRLKFSYIGMILIPLILAMSLSYNQIEDRINSTLVEIHKISNGDMTSSIGLRFQMWKSARYSFVKSPIYGLGDSHREVLIELNKEGLVDDSLVKFSPNHYHNQFIDKLVKTGIIGLISMLTLLLTPLIVAYKNKKESKSLIFYLTLLMAISCLTDVPINHPVVLMPFLLINYIFISDMWKCSNDDTSKPPH